MAGEDSTLINADSDTTPTTCRQDVSLAPPLDLVRHPGSDPGRR